MSICRVSLARLAPNAALMDSSGVRSTVRAISRFATFVHAISRTKMTAASNAREAFFTGPASPSRREVMCGRSLRLLFPPVFGESLSASTCSADWACCQEMPDFKRATASQPLLAGANAAGFHIAALPG